jgi:hypothetical protein
MLHPRGHRRGPSCAVRQGGRQPLPVRASKDPVSRPDLPLMYRAKRVEDHPVPIPGRDNDHAILQRGGGAWPPAGSVVGRWGLARPDAVPAQADSRDHQGRNPRGRLNCTSTARTDRPTHRPTDLCHRANERVREEAHAIGLGKRRPEVSRRGMDPETHPRFHIDRDSNTRHRSRLSAQVTGGPACSSTGYEGHRPAAVARAPVARTRDLASGSQGRHWARVRDSLLKPK